MQAFAILLQECEGAHNRVMETLTNKIEEKIESVMDKSIDKMSALVESALANQKDMQTTTATLAGATESLQKMSVDISKSVKEATATSDQLTNTMSTYKEALLTTSSPTTRGPTTMAPKHGEDPRLTRDLERKKCQILLELNPDETTTKSITELKEKIDAALNSMSPSPPEGAKVQEINKLRNGGIILQLVSKEAADWLRDPINELAFTSKLDDNAYIRDRVYPILVPRVPLTLDPNSQEHLREIESMNDLMPKTIRKARWIKPEYRRNPKQRFAYATISLSSASEANRLIRDGMYICSTRVFPKRLKYEPKQCMKCRRWGHFASECRATTNTCGTCGGEHATRDCEDPNKRHCVACRSDEHSSWDRTCPEFLRKSAHFDEMHPENALTYFPTEESWTLNARPERIPLDDRFPSRHAVGSLPPASRTVRPPPTRPIERRQRRQNPQREDAAQRTLDGFIETQPSSKHVRFVADTANADKQQESDEEAEADKLIQSAIWSD